MIWGKSRVVSAYSGPKIIPQGPRTPGINLLNPIPEKWRDQSTKKEMEMNERVHTAFRPKKGAEIAKKQHVEKEINQYSWRSYIFPKPQWEENINFPDAASAMQLWLIETEVYNFGRRGEVRRRQSY